MSCCIDRGSTGCLRSFPFQIPTMEGEDKLRSRHESGAIVVKLSVQQREVPTTMHLINLNRGKGGFMVAQKIVFLFWATTHPLFNKESAFIDIPSQPPPLHTCDPCP